MKIFLFILMLVGGFMALESNAVPLVKSTAEQGTQTESKRVIKILAIDGGGIRGLIPIKILMEIERRLGGDIPIATYFDVMGGTSAGGIIVLILNVQSEDGSPMYWARHLHSIYNTFAKDVFKVSFFRKIGSLWGWSGPKYSNENLISSLKNIFGDATLSETYTDVIIPSYNLLDENNFMFRTNRALEHKERDFYMVDVGTATSSAPTYFKPAEIQDLDKKHKYLMVDGGVSANNPSLSALTYAFNQYRETVDYFVVSIGTGHSATPVSIGTGGKFGWASSIIPILMDSVNDVTNYEMLQLLPEENYYRIQISIDPEHSAMDDATDENIAALEKYADDYIRNHSDVIDKIVEGLKK
jgi:patatin-like phospholipase/acyl hydrolase